MMYDKQSILNTEIADRFIDSLYAIKGAEYLTFREDKCYFLNNDYEVLAVMNKRANDYTYVVDNESIEVVLITEGKRYTDYSIQAAVNLAKQHSQGATIYLRYKPFRIEEKIDYKDHHITGIRLKHHRKVVNDGNFDVDLYSEANRDFAAWHEYMYTNIRF